MDNHSCFKNVLKLPVAFAANNKAKMISDISQQYINGTI